MPMGIDIGDACCDGLGEEVAVTESYVKSVPPQVFLPNQGRSKACTVGESDVEGDAVVGLNVVGVGEERRRFEKDDVVDRNVFGKLGDDVFL